MLFSRLPFAGNSQAVPCAFAWHTTPLPNRCRCWCLSSRCTALCRWRYGEVSGNPRWKGMAWGMLPCLGSAMCACTWHLFFNAPELQVGG